MSNVVIYDDSHKLFLKLSEVLMRVQYYAVRSFCSEFKSHMCPIAIVKMDYDSSFIIWYIRKLNNPNQHDIGGRSKEHETQSYFCYSFRTLAKSTNERIHFQKRHF